jgi:hypothetical protein
MGSFAESAKSAIELAMIDQAKGNKRYFLMTNAHSN